MTIQEFASMLNGRQYSNEITKQEESQAKELGFVVIFGASDDLCELRGAIDDEVDCCGGGEFSINSAGIVTRPDCDCEHARKWHNQQLASAVAIEAVWCPRNQNDEVEMTWGYKLPENIPHATFDILDDEEHYCRGVVFELKSVTVGANRA